MTSEWISISEASRRLTAAGDVVSRQGLSRYIARHAEAIPVRWQGKAMLVDLEVVTAHRAANIRVHPPEATADDHEDVPSERMAARRFAGSKADAVARKAQADAELKEMDLAVRRRTLTPTSEVDRAGRDAVALMLSAFDRAVDTEAAAMAARHGWDERAVRSGLKAFVRSGTDVFHREVLKRLDDMRRQEDLGRQACSDYLTES